MSDRRAFFRTLLGQRPADAPAPPSVATHPAAAEPTSAEPEPTEPAPVVLRRNVRPVAIPAVRLQDD